ncbi:uncharacterized protein METZ01_LOCUS87358 [marine metagenome]|uniref:triose-phosphate isomerase n=1 Tax=marine metagenome TaxID=408172 RepID=A0A381V2S8_9ZZZZ
MLKSIVAGNWKMNKTPREGKTFIIEVASSLPIINNVNVIFCPPFTGLYNIDISPPYYLGAQNCFYKGQGAYTGEISIEMLLECNVEYVIIGHSERRHIFHENNELIGKKMSRVINAGMKPILCIGETIVEMNNGKTYDIIEEQIIKGLTNVKSIDNIIIAYEPVWAIGTGLTATVEKINEMHTFIRKILSRLYTNNNSDKTPILYGGSVNSDNANELISIDGVNGFLIGGASLDVIKFTDVVKIVNEQ